MRRADRLFQIVQFLRSRRVTTARWLAERLEVSERTIYRDVRDLLASGVPIDGEAGIGYAIRRGFDLPPLMFSREELDALAFGARIVESWADPALATAARSVLSKVQTVLPDNLKNGIDAATLFSPMVRIQPEVAATMGCCARASTAATRSNSTTPAPTAKKATAASGRWDSFSGDRSGRSAPGANCAKPSAASGWIE